MKAFYILVAAALIATVAARHGKGRGEDRGNDNGGGWNQDGNSGPKNGWGFTGPQGPQGGWDQGPQGPQGGPSFGDGGPQGGWGPRGGWGPDGDGDGDRHHGGHHGGHHGDWCQQTNNCSKTNRIIIISDYIPFTDLSLNCIGTCYFQSNAVLSAYDTQTYNKSDSVVIMVGPYSIPNNTTMILSNSTLLTGLIAMTNVYVSTIPLSSDVNDTTIIANVAAANALVKTAAATPGAHLIDYQQFFNMTDKYFHRWNAYQMCMWVHDRLVDSGVVFP